jgi:rare lipoprotein A
VVRVRSLALIVGVALAACSGTATSKAEPAHAQVRGEESGLASYYSSSLAGHKTANGEKYDPDLLTAAHRSLPFGTIVEVTRPDGRTVQVRINDRGPFAKGRVIDLSLKAAEEIGLTKEGVARVTVKVVD